MPISLRAASGGGAGVPIGGFQDFNEWLAPDLDINGARYLRSGYIETDTSKFDNTIWANTAGTFFQNETLLPAASSENDFVVASADNGTNTIVAIRGVNGVQTQFYVSTNSGATWQIVDAGVGAIKANEIIYVSSLGLFVVAIDTGKILTSANGTTWTVRYNNSGDGDIVGLAFGAGRLVAVSNGNKVITSTNGTSWSYATTVPATTGMRDVAFGAGKFIIAALANQCLTSTNGNIWSIQNLNLEANHQLNGITYGNGLWVTSHSTGGALIWKSSDGITFTKVNTSTIIGTYGTKTRIKFVNGFWLAPLNSGTIRSVDLYEWLQLSYTINSSAPLLYGFVNYHLGKWTMFRMAYAAPNVTSTSVSFSLPMYAGSHSLMYSYPVITSGGMVDSKQRLVKYVRIS